MNNDEFPLCLKSVCWFNQHQIDCFGGDAADDVAVMRPSWHSKRATKPDVPRETRTFVDADPHGGCPRLCHGVVWRLSPYCVVSVCTSGSYVSNVARVEKTSIQVANTTSDVRSGWLTAHRWRQRYRGRRTAGKKRVKCINLKKKKKKFSMTRVCSADQPGCTCSFLRHHQRAAFLCRLLKGAVESLLLMFEFWLTDCDYLSSRQRDGHFKIFSFFSCLPKENTPSTFLNCQISLDAAVEYFLFVFFFL